MYVDRSKSHQNNRVYFRYLLRESYRQGGKVKHRTVANLSRCSEEEINAIRIALRYKGNLSKLVLGSGDIHTQQGPSVGAVWVVYEIARRLGIEECLGRTHESKLALWQVIARVIDQGSRLSAVRLAESYGACDVLKIRKAFTEDDLYENLSWLRENQEEIEKRLFQKRDHTKKRTLFLYDVTSSYLEGQCNALGEYGYNRDKKKGKKQILIGLLCDDEGEPVSVDVFKGNIKDPETFVAQIKKVEGKFGCERVAFVGDRGMIKSTQIKALDPDKFRYITAITKPEIEARLKRGIFQMSLFDEDIAEIEAEGVRYIFRRNAERAEEVRANRESKEDCVIRLAAKRNRYLQEHRRAKVSTAVKEVEGKIEQLKIANWLKVKIKGRVIHLEVDGEALEQESKLDGCYVIKTDLSKTEASRKVVHDRYKDLALVERTFRTMKTVHLEARPIFVRTEDHTRAHIFVVMLAYMIVRTLYKCWINLNITVEEAIKELNNLCVTDVLVRGKTVSHSIPRPRERSREILKAANITLPSAISSQNIHVATRKRLPSRRNLQ